MATQALRWEILARVVEVLKGISPGAGYLTQPKLVTLDWWTGAEFNAFPAIGVTEAPETDAFAIRYFSDMFEDRYRFRTYGAVRGDGAGRTRVWQLEALYEDIHRVFMANATLRTPGAVDLVSDVVPFGPRRSDAGLEGDKGVFYQDWIARYNAVFPGP